MRGEGARLPAAVLDSRLSKSVGEYAVKGEPVRAGPTSPHGRRREWRLRGPILIGLKRFAPVEVCGPKVHEAVLAIWK